MSQLTESERYFSSQGATICRFINYTLISVQIVRRLTQKISRKLRNHSCRNYGSITSSRAAFTLRKVGGRLSRSLTDLHTFVCINLLGAAIFLNEPLQVTGVGG